MLNMELQDILALLHPAIAIIVVFPLIGIVVNRALLTRQRRLEVAGGQKSKIPPVVGSEHVAIGNWLSGSVVGVALLGMAYPILSKMLSNDTLTKEPFRVFFAIAIFLLTIASFTLLFKAKVKLWRGIFPTFTGMGLMILGCQPEIYRLDNQWFVSHYYYGITAAYLGNGESQSLNAGEVAIAEKNQIHGAVNDNSEDAVFVSIYSAPQIGYEKASP
jgi:hypothetical protein